MLNKSYFPILQSTISCCALIISCGHWVKLDQVHDDQVSSICKLEERAIGLDGNLYARILLRVTSKIKLDL